MWCQSDHGRVEIEVESLVCLQCPSHGLQLNMDESGNRYECSSGCVFPVLNGIPRFVSEKHYALSFGEQWKAFRKVQLDSYTGYSISRDRLTRIMGGSLDGLKGNVVLEAGCGAGRFTEVLLNAGAHVFAVDLSSAVEANAENCGKYKECFLCQADVLNLPVKPEQFDVVVAIGMIQHTPCPEKTIAALCSHLKPGGLLALDHYTYGYGVTRARRLLRSFLLRNGPDYNLRFCKRLVSVLWPIHRLFWKYRATRWVPRVRNLFLAVSPVVDYHGAYPQLSPDLLRTWAILDTHDTLTDVYKHLRSKEEICQCLQRNCMTEIETVYAGNGVEARAKKPVR